MEPLTLLYIFIVGITMLSIGYVMKVIFTRPEKTKEPIPQQTDADDVDDDRGICIVKGCSYVAQFRSPVVEHDREFGERYRRRVGALPQLKFKLAMPEAIGDNDPGVCLCGFHFHRARSLMELNVIAATTMSYAAWVDERTRAAIRYQATGLLEDLNADAPVEQAAAEPTAVVEDIGKSRRRKKVTITENDSGEIAVGS